MPIYDIAGITGTHTEDETASVKVGDIRKGEKEERKNKRGETYEIPRNLDYFRVVIRDDLEDLKNAFERHTISRPRMLRVQLAYPTLDESWWAWNSIYKSGGMLGLNDGLWWNYLRDPSTNDVLVSDYMLTSKGTEQVEDKYLFGFAVCNMEDAFSDYRHTYHRQGMPIPRAWKKVEDHVHRGDAVIGLTFDGTVPIYKTEKREYLSSPEGRLMVTMPHLELFTSFHLFQFKTGSINDIRTISQNLANIAAQARVFDSDLGSISLDAIPMRLVRREEQISKMINDKLVRGPEWLVHIETLPRWQGLVDSMNIRRNVALLYSVTNQELGGLSETAEHLELPEVVDPVVVLAEIGEVQEPKEDEPDPETEEEDRAAAKIKKAVRARAKQSEASYVETEVTPRKKPATKSKAKPRADDVPDPEEQYQASKKLVEDGRTKVDAHTFWASAFGMGYTQKTAEEFLVSEDWKDCLVKAVEDYEQKAE